MKKKCTIFALAIKENRSLDHLTIHRGVEQLAARRAHNPEVGGSSPPPATIEEIREGFLFFVVYACKRCYYVAFEPQWWVVMCASAPNHPPLHHATFGGTLATITLTVCICGSATHLNIGGCADRVESIARPLVCAIMYPRYGFAVRVLLMLLEIYPILTDTCSIAKI